MGPVDAGYVALLAPAEVDLARKVTYTNRKGEEWTYPVGQILRHVANHATHHRGQLTTMLRQLGHVPPTTDFLVFVDLGAAWARTPRAGADDPFAAERRWPMCRPIGCEGVTPTAGRFHGREMTQPDAPLGRSIGFAGVVRWLIAVAAVIAIGGAFAAGRDLLAIAGIVFLVVALTLGYRARRARQ